MSSCRCRNSGSGKASRHGIPSISLPGSVSRITSLTASQTCDGPRCNVTVYARARAGSPDLTLTASLPVSSSRPIFEDRRANSPDTTGLRRSLLREDTEVFHSGWESVGEIIARLRQ